MRLYKLLILFFFLFFFYIFTTSQNPRLRPTSNCARLEKAREDIPAVLRAEAIGIDMHLNTKIAWSLPNFQRVTMLSNLITRHSMPAQMTVVSGSIMFQMNNAPASRTMAMRLL